VDALRIAHLEWLEESLRGEASEREEIWPQSVAVGSAEFSLRTQTALQLRGRNRVIAEKDDVFVLREGEESYGSIFGVKNEPIMPKNTIYLDVSC